MGSESICTVEWSEFQIIQKTYLTKKKAELAMLYQAFENEDFQYIKQQMSFYIENAKMYGFPRIEAYALKTRKNIIESNYTRVFGNLSELDVVIQDYSRQF